MKRVFLDTETTGLSPEKGHRIVEIAAIAYENNASLADDEIFHCYLNPQREVDEEAREVHGLSDDFLARQPLFKDVADRFTAFIRGAELIIHNAEFDCAFIDAEFDRLGYAPITDVVERVVCSLELSRKNNSALRRHSLDALCDHFGVDASERTTHNALLDTKLLAQVYFRMVQRQMEMSMSDLMPSFEFKGGAVRVVKATAAEVDAHARFLQNMEADSGVSPLFNGGEK